MELVAVGGVAVMMLGVSHAAMVGPAALGSTNPQFTDGSGGIRATSA
jgi:hypothetical protein